ncbi:stearoyl-CoA desaturase [Actinorhabdospora filicis]|uniref:Stearoyl-CoA desaturase n=1 Tax=Actinorhabdospora filicis TaxID=1785913 RepID=A0A9W6W846_9ACTN|nr:acyl-CoA desaturase [Actinorhabdospora filicis]GLZ76598.1 stearoyl-CoA desaturase [Actinorhabdospora filicis]
MTTPALDAATGSVAKPVNAQAPKPLTSGKQGKGILIGLWAFVVLPFIALVAAVPFAWGWGLSWIDIAIAFVMYCISGFGVTIGFHRYFTHGGFKAKRWLRVTLAVSGSMAVEGSVIQWVADHRRHHMFSDVEGDPHSPWRYGTTFGALAKGMWHAHIGWMFSRELSNQERFTPDLLADKDIRRVDALFPWLTVITAAAPAVAGGLLTLSWQGAVTAFFWATLIRIGLLHHVTWSINSVCHVWGERPFSTRDGDQATNFWPLAIISMGENWHNLHHADPTSARHGALRGQIDPSARIIWFFEKMGWVTNVRWPKQERLEKLQEQQRQKKAEAKKARV